MSFRELLIFYLFEKPVHFASNFYFDFKYGIKNLKRFFGVVLAWLHWDAYYKLMVLRRIFEIKYPMWLDDMKHHPCKG